MSEIHKKKHNFGWLVWVITLLILLDLGLLINRQLQSHNVALFNSKGLIAHQQQSLMLFTGAIMLLIAIPAIALFYFTAWKYRESNTKATYDPEMRRSKWLDISVWTIPTIFMLVLASVMWPATHRLAPQRAIASNTKPLRVQVVSMRWKWLFIYPEQGIATVNYLQVPVDTPLELELTADEAPMSSFWIPNLGGQLYTMTGHVNHMNLMAETPGDYPGSSAELNGVGFSEMRFKARASNTADFNEWVENVRQSPDELDSSKYESILKPSIDVPVAFYSSYESDLYAKVVMKYTGPSGGHAH